MPISDEVIELAPVKKTKKTLIIMIAGMGVLFALAVVFLVMYLIKPSVTEDTNHVKDITLVTNELFSETVDGEVKYYASIGNEYTVYSTLTVDNNSSTNVQWDCDPDLLEIKSQKNDGEASLTFIPRVGMHGQKAKITVRAPSQVSEYKTIEFTIVNQGAEDIRVTQYGVRGNLTPVNGDNKDKDLSITVPYYSMSGSKNNQNIQVKFDQLSKLDPTSQEYAKLTSVILNGQQTDAVTVTSSDESIISINQDTVSNDGFSFVAKKHSNGQYVTITIKANVYNDDCDEVTKTIRVKVEPNGTLGYVDSIYVFNKPIVDAEFIGKVKTQGNNALIDSSKLKNEIATANKAGESIKMMAFNDNQVVDNSDFALVLPYSNNNSITYNDIFKHILLNPLDIQYDGENLKNAWYKNIDVSLAKPAESSILQVTTNSSTGEVKLYPRNVASKVELTIKDKKQGSAGASITIPVRIVAQTEKVELAYGKTTADASNPDIEVVAAVGTPYEVNVTYTFVAPSRDNAKTLWEENCLNNKFKLDFVPYNDEEKTGELKVALKSAPNTFLDPNKEYSADYGDTLAKVSGTSGASTKYTATITFIVTVKMDTTGAAKFAFIKNGSDIYGDADDSNSLKSKDKAAELSASFTITESAQSAWIIKDDDVKDEGNHNIGLATALNIVTNTGETAGNFVRHSDTEASIYLQNQTGGELSIISPTNIQQFVRADKSYFQIAAYKTTTRDSTVLSRDRSEILSFAGGTANPNAEAGRVTFEVHNVRNEKIATLIIKIYIIDAITDIIPVESKQTAQYNAAEMESVTILASDVKVVRSFDKSPKDYTYSDVELYCGNLQLDKDTDASGNYVFKHDGQELYKFDREHKLSTLTDIYAYSYEKGINFGNVELEFLINEADEYIGKHYNRPFTYKQKMKLEFERLADGAALFTDSDYTNEVRPNATEGFNVSVNQDSDGFLYVTSIVNIVTSTETKTVYVERKTETKGHIAPVQKATFSLPSGIRPSTSSAQSSTRYYSMTYRSPVITEQSVEYKGGNVYYASTSIKLMFTVNNVTRKISSIGIYSNESCTESLAGGSLLFGGFINEANKYSNPIWVKVTYENHQSSFTSFEGAELSLPSYLKLSGKTPIDGTNTYVLHNSSYSSEKSEDKFPCTLVLDKDEEVTDAKTVKVAPSDHKESGQSVEFTANVHAGLKTLIVKNGETTVATVTAGNTGVYPIPFNLKKPSDIKTLKLKFEYGATNTEGYNLSYDHTGAGLKVVAPTAVDGFGITNNIKNATSEFAIASTESIKTGKQKFTLTFTDEYNGAEENNVFALEIEITVTMDIYELAFADNVNTTITVTGAASGTQSLTIPVKYNGDNTNTQPSADVIKANTVLGVYVLNGTDYEAAEGGIMVTRDDKDASGKTFTVKIPNNVDRTKQYYLMLTYDNVDYNADVHLRSIKVSTLTSHIEFDKANSIKPTQATGEPCPSASIVVTSASDTFTLVANVVNDGTGNVETAKSIEKYGLYTDFDCTSTNEIKTGITVNDGVIKVINPTKISDTIYYLAKYTEQSTGKSYTLKVKLTYTVAPSAVAISGVDTNAFDSANDTLTLYYGNANNYTQANLSGKIVASTAFGGAAYSTENVTYTVALQNASDSAYLDISGLVLKPIALKNNALTTVPVVVTATYAGVETDEKVYNVIITPFATLTQGSGSLSLTNKDAQLTVTPNIATYGGFTHTYTLSAATTANGVFTITGADDVKTVKLAEGTTAKKGDYTLTETVSYSYAGVANGGITAVGTFASTATYTVTVVGDYALTFDLMAGNSVITPYDSTKESTKYSVVNESVAYSVKVTSADTSFVTTNYGATVTPNVVSVAAFSGKTATVTLTPNASGAFTIAVTATVGGQTYTVTKNYYFVYGANVTAKLYTSQNGSAYTVFNGTEQNIDYTTTPYTFKYEIDGISNDVKDEDIKLVVNGAVTTDAMQKEGSKRYWIITATKATIMRIGASVKIGSRTVYLEEKTVELTATAPDFTLTADKEAILPSQSLTMSIGKAADFLGTYTVSYALQSGSAYATINTTTGVLTANTNVVTDQTVIVRATITVSNGVYAGPYTLDKSVTVTGVALPTIAFNSGAAREVGIGETDYTRDSYTFNGVVGDYTYSDISYSLSASSTLLTNTTDYELNGNKLTVKNTEKTRAGGSIQLTVTATITSGAHKDESVSDTITVRVLPTMSTSVSFIALGNAAATYDLNGERFKSTFAPITYDDEGFVNAADKYAVVSLEIDDTTNFGVDGAKFTVKNDLTTATTFNVKATVLITSGAYAGTTVVGTKEIRISVPSASLGENVEWNTTSYEYKTITLNNTKVLGSAITGTVSGITVVLPEAVEQYVTVANNGKASPVVSVNKNYGAYFTNTEPTKTFTVNYVVTLANGNVYYSSAQYTVAPQKVTISAKVGDEPVGDSGITVNANETFIMQLTADKGFDVVIDAVSANAVYNAIYGGNGIQINVGSVTSDQNVPVELTLNVAGQTTTYSFDLAVLAPQTNAQYTANNTENTGFAVNSGELHDQDNAVTSTWSAANRAQYKYGQKLTITAPNERKLNEYFDSLVLVFNGQHSANNLNVNSATIDFPVITESGMFGTSTKRYETGTFNLAMQFKTNAAIPLSTIEVKFTVYNKERNGSAIDVTVLYRVQVIGEVSVTLNANAGDDTVEVEYSNPLYKHSYNLPTETQVTRTGYTLDGWYTAEKGGSKVAANAIVTNTQPHTLYARWTAKTYNLRYNANYTDAPVISANKTVTYGQTYGELNTPTRAGYDFIGWTAASEANSQVITADTLVKPANANVSTITLYAQWRIRYYTVTLDANGGMLYGTTDTMTAQVHYNGSFTLHNAIVPTRDGYRFNGWNASGNTSNVTGNVTLTAQWIPLYTVSFDANVEGMTNPQSVQMANGDAYALPTLTRDEYSFDGWFTEATGGNEVTSETVVNLSEDQTLYAHWTKVVFTVSFYVGDGVEGIANPQSVKVTNGGNYGYFPTLTRDGYVFDGWYNGDEKVETGDTVNLTADVTLTAKWKKVYTVVFAIGSTDGYEVDELPAIPESMTVVEGQTITLQGMPNVRANNGTPLDFCGYSLSPSDIVAGFGLYEYTVNGDNADENAVITLYANWYTGE